MAGSCEPDEGLRPSSQRPQYPTLYRRLKRRLGRSLRAKFYQEIRLHINALELKAVSQALRYFKDPCQDQTVLVVTDNSTVVALHKETRRNTLRNVCSPVENHDLVPSLPHNIKSQTHSRMSECDGRPTVQIESGAVKRMVTASTGVQTDLPKVVHSPYRPICHSSEPQASTVRVSYPRRKGLGHRCSKKSGNAIS